MEKDELVDTLNALIDTCKDGEDGFTSSAEQVRSHNLRQIFAARVMACRAAALELQRLVRQYGGEAEDEGRIAGAVHRGWVAARATPSGCSDLAMLEACVQGDNATVGHYRMALHLDLPVKVLLVVQRQLTGVQRNHEQIRRLRDEARANDRPA